MSSLPMYVPCAGISDLISVVSRLAFLYIGYDGLYSLYIGETYVVGIVGFEHEHVAIALILLAFEQDVEQVGA